MSNYTLITGASNRVGEYFVRALAAGRRVSIFNFRSRKLPLSASALTAALLLVIARPLACQDLPPAEQVIKKVIEKAKREPGERQEPKYVYSLRNVIEELDERGGQKERRERLYQAVIIDGEHYNRLIQKNGKPLTAEDQKRELERERKFRHTAAERKRKKAKEENEVALNEELLGRYKIEVVNREPVNGRSALVATFEPKRKDLPAKRRIDFLLNKLAGKLWIDEQEYEIAKAQFHLTEPASKYAGILASVRKFDGTFEQTRLDNGEWLPRQFENYFEGRIVFKSLYQRTRQEWSDYKKAGQEEK